MEFEEEKLTEALVLARTRAVDLENVKKLNFWGSEITDISVVRSMPNLEVCSVRHRIFNARDESALLLINGQENVSNRLSVNSITTLEDFSHCPNLQELYIRKNKIQSLKEICHLKKLQKLRNLWLADNPCASEENYRHTVLRNLPKLQKLDNVVVKDTEVEEAKEKGEEYPGGDEEENEEPEQELEEKKPTAKSMLDPVTLTWEETNKIRGELGLKPLPYEKMTSPKPSPQINSNRSRNAHVLQAVLILIRELDNDSLEIVNSAIQKKLQTNSAE